MIKDKVLALLERARLEEHAFLLSLTPQERTVVGTPVRWSARDVLAHNAAWKLRLSQRLLGEVVTPMPMPGMDVDMANAQTFAEHVTMPFPDVVGKSLAATSQLEKLVKIIPEDALLAADRLPWQNGRVLWRTVVGVGFSHPLAHLGRFYFSRGQLEDATRLNETITERLQELDESPAWQAVVVYNLACFYALCGRKDEAIAALRQSMAMFPELGMQASKDTDFYMLRSEPGFKALFAR